MYNIIIDNIYSCIDPQLPLDLNTKLHTTLRYHPPGYQKTYYYKSKKWDGWSYVYDMNEQKFRTGLVWRVVKTLERQGQECKFIDLRGKKEVIKHNINLNGITPYPFQNEAGLASLNQTHGILASPTGCHIKGQKILMYNGSIKVVEDIIVNDLLMGPDSKPRKVKSLIRNKGKMVKIIPNKGESFIVNEDHILTLQCTNGNKANYKNIVDVSVKEYLNWNKYRKHCYKLFRVPVIFNKRIKLPLDPYFLGLLLGDGTLCNYNVAVTTKDHSIIGKEVYKQAKNHSLKVRRLRDNRRDVSTYFIKGNDTIGNNKVLNKIKKLNLFNTNAGTKFIPHVYKTSSRNNRLKLLAGLIDTDGHLSWSGVYDYITKSFRLADDIAYISRSLGFSANINKCKKEATTTGFVGTYYRICISGEISNIPCRLKRKKAKIRKQKKSVLRTGFKIKKIGVDNYYGFNLNGDGRFLLGDFTVTHNTGKTIIMSLVIQNNEMRTLIIVNSRVLLDQTFEFFDKIMPNQIGIVGSGDFELNNVVIATMQSLSSILGLGKKQAAGKKAPALKDWLDNVGLVIHDEVHEADNKSVEKFYSIVPAHRFIGTTATPYSWAFATEKGKNLEMEQHFGIKVFDSKEDTDFIKLGLTVPLFVNRFTTPVVEAYSEYNSSVRTTEEYNDIIKNQVVENEERTMFLAKKAREMVHSGLSCYVYYNRIVYGEALCEAMSDLDPVMLQGSTPRAKRKQIFKDLNEKKLLLVVSDIGSYGLNIPSLDSILLAWPVRDLRQLKGRVCRAYSGKKQGIVIDPIDNAPYLIRHAELRKNQILKDGNIIVGY